MKKLYNWLLKNNNGENRHSSDFKTKLRINALLILKQLSNSLQKLDRTNNSQSPDSISEPVKLADNQPTKNDQLREAVDQLNQTIKYSKQMSEDLKQTIEHSDQTVEHSKKIISDIRREKIKKIAKHTDNN